MVPPLEANTTFEDPARRAPSSTLMLPMTFTSASRTGSATDTRTSAWAARWKTTSGCRRPISSTSPVDRTSSWWKDIAFAPEERASARLARLPVDRSSTTSTVWPSARRRSTRVEPMKPAPPVTRVCTGLPGVAGVLEHGAGLDGHPAPDHGGRHDLRSLPDARVVADHRSLDPGARSDHHPVQQHRALDAGTLLHPDPGPEDRRPHVGALGHGGALPHQGRPLHRAGQLGAVEYPDSGPDVSRPRRRRRATKSGHQVAVGPQVEGGRAGVDPVGVRRQGEERALLHQ